MEASKINDFSRPYKSVSNKMQMGEGLLQVEYLSDNDPVLFRKGVSDDLEFGSKSFAVTTPRREELDKHTLVSVHILKVT